MNISPLNSDIICYIGKYCSSEIYSLNRYYRERLILDYDINLRVKFRWLNNACKYDITNCLQMFIETKYSKDISYLEFLYTCIINNSFNCFALLLESDVIKVDSHGYHILDLMFIHDRVDMLKIVVNPNVIPWKINNLTHAINKADIQIITYLFTHPKILEIYKPPYVVDILVNAIRRGKLSIVNFLLENSDYSRISQGEIFTLEDEVRQCYLDHKYCIVLTLIKKFGEDIVDSDLYKWSAEDDVRDVCLAIDSYSGRCLDYAIRYGREKLSVLLLKPLKNKDQIRLPEKLKMFECACKNNMWSLAKHMIIYGYTDAYYMGLEDCLLFLEVACLYGSPKLVKKLLGRYNSSYHITPMKKLIAAIKEQSWFDSNKPTMKKL